MQFNIDPAHRAVDIFAQDITKHVWEEKYRWGTEKSPQESLLRVCRGVYQYDDKLRMEEALEAMELGLWVPGGRIHAGAGTDKVVTMHNCYVMDTIGDSMLDIGRVLVDSMLTMQQGGGIGMNFGTLRPSGAHLNRTQAVASGPLPFMDMWNAMCGTIMSAGSRRGAMMGVITDDHPDLPAFIEAKHKQGRMTNFNISILITDAFMDAVAMDEEWELGFNVPRADGKHLGVVDRDRLGKWYIYSKWRARELWDKITQSTYEYSEPGVIFIDRVNEGNNLKYVEDIAATNPCGEQPLPPNGACNLGAVNLARMVRDPFGRKPEFDFELLEKVVRVGVRFLDNVIDVSGYPLALQHEEQKNKRRLGLGITGLGNALAMMKLRYGTEASLHFTEAVMSRIKEVAYDASADLAEERGPFPLYHSDRWGDTDIVRSLPEQLREKIRRTQMRNGVILTIAPTGTTSLYMGNCSSGLEPVFLMETERRVLQADGSHRTFTVTDYGFLVYRHVMNTQGIIGTEVPYLVTHEDLSVEDHVRIQSVCQTHVDASVSKTINCPEEIDYEAFKLVYWDAYNSGCKGCTTYRPSEVRGSVLGPQKVQNLQPTDRPETLAGRTHKIKWPNTDASYYITINELNSKPFEMFISSTSGRYSDWTTALSLMISAIMRLGYDITFVPDELKKVSSPHDQAWVDGVHYGSLVALIGDTIGKHLRADVEISDVDGEPSIAQLKSTARLTAPISGTTPSHTVRMKGEVCPKCNQPTLMSQEGCKSCTSCGFSNCG